MTKLLILNGDQIEQEIEVNKDGHRFVFLITEDNKVFHLDTTDGKLHEASAVNFQFLSFEHQEIVRARLNRKKEAVLENKNLKS